MLASTLIASLIVRLFILAHPQPVWWDGAIYVGMGKAIFSHGTVGLWESFRPVVWPAILGFFWKIGLEPYTTGVFIVLLSSIIAIYATYKIGERLEPGSGLYAAVLLGFTPIFLGLTPVPLTDIPALCLGLLAFLAFLDNRFFVSGLLAASSFLLRFPLALLSVVFFGVLLSVAWEHRRLKPLLSFVVGCAPLIIGFFIFNYFIYHDFAFPIRVGSQVASQSVSPGDGNPFFYIIGTFAQNPFFVFIIVFLFALILKPREFIKNKALLITLLSIIFLGGYFSSFPHKEVRYALAFIPYVALGAGYGIATVFERVSYRRLKPILAIIIASALLFISMYIVKEYWWQSLELPLAKMAFYNYFKDKPGAKILGSSPQFSVFSDLKIVDMDDAWEGLYEKYQSYSDFNYVVLDSCQLVCNSSKCDNAKAAFIQNLEQKDSVVFNATEERCTYTIYKVTR